MKGRGRAPRNWAQLRRIWITPVLFLVGALTLFLGATFGWDWYFNYSPEDGVTLDPFSLLINYDIETLQNVLGNLAQTVAAVVGIVITVVAIVVQLSATRYTPRVTEMFFKEKTNFIVLGFFVISCAVAIWVSLAVGHGFIPKVSVAICVVVVTLSLLLMFPYIAYVFNFLDPDKVVGRIREHTEDAATAPIADVPKQQLEALNGIEQLADVAITAVSSQDKLISAQAVDAMRSMLVGYIGTKTALPIEWFEPCAKLREKPDFVAMHPDAMEDIVSDGVWLEWMVLRQYQAIYNESLEQNPDMNYLIAINTRYLGEAALAHEVPPVLILAVKFFNTYLRQTLNKKQVRTAYNILNQYRQLVEAIVVAGRHDMAVEIANYLRYYGQIANGMGLSFVTETIAYDVASLCELSHRENSSAHEALLAGLLELDKEAESEAQELALRGVRKAQLRLATFYLLNGHEGHARRIHRDMKEERPERLASIRDELQQIQTKDFWEVIDRGANFDYMSEDRKEQLGTFFSWFEWGEAPKPESAGIQLPQSGRWRVDELTNKP